MSEVRTFKITGEIKKKLKRHHVNVSETVRELLERYLAELETTKLEQKLELLRERLSSKIDQRVVAQLVREDRERR